MLCKLGRGKLFQFPWGYTAFPTLFEKPFVAQPPCCPAVFRQSDQKATPAMSGNFCVVSFFGYLSDPVQDTFARWPELNFVYQQIKINSFSVVPFLRLTQLFRLLWHTAMISVSALSISASSLILLITLPWLILCSTNHQSNQPILLTGLYLVKTATAPMTQSRVIRTEVAI